MLTGSETQFSSYLDLVAGQDRDGHKVKGCGHSVLGSNTLYFLTQAKYSINTVVIIRTRHHSGHSGHRDDDNENASQEEDATDDQDSSLPSPPLWAQLSCSLSQPPMSFLPPGVIFLVSSPGHFVRGQRDLAQTSRHSEDMIRL